jgi:beta-galactosidase
VTPDGENPRVFGINKEPAHATLHAFPTLKQAESDDRNEKDEFTQSLDGLWKFH